MRTMVTRMFSAIMLFTLALTFASCKEKSIAGRVYSGNYGGSQATVSFDKDGSAHFEIAGKVSASLEYESENNAFSGYNVSHPAMEFKGKYDDDALLLIWWGGDPMILYRTENGKRIESSNKHKKNGIAGKTYAGLYDDSFVSISFEKFGLVLITVDDETTHSFYTEDTKARKVTVREEYNDRDAEDFLSFHYDDDMIRGKIDDEEIVLEDLDKKLAANHVARADSGKKNSTTRELTPPKEKHTKTYDTLVKYGFRTSEGTIDSDYISVSRSQYLALSGINAVFISDDGGHCFLDRKFLTQPDGVERNTLTTPTHLDITGCIKEILYATEGTTLRHAFVLIECKESENRNILLQNTFGKNWLGDFIQGKIFSEVDKNYSLEEKSSDLMKAIKDSNDWYYSESLRWFIDK